MATAIAKNVKISDAGPSRKKIAIEIPADVVKGKLEESFAALATQAELPGFRRGKAPRSLIEKRFGKSVRDEAKGQLVAQAYSQAIEESKLKVLGDPTSETLGAVELDAGKPLAFELEVEVMPEFESPKLDGLEIIRPTIEVTDEAVEKELTNLKINEGELEGRDQAEQGDYCTGHAIMKDEKGTEFYNINGAVIQSPPKDKDGKGMILGIVVEDFAKQIGKPKVGDTVTVKCKGPENHEVEGVRNASLTVTFKVERIDRILPAGMDKVLKAVGMDAEPQLRDAISNRLRQNVLVQQQTALRQQVARFLLQNTKFDLPQRLTAQQAARNLERQRLELMYRGVKPAEIEEHIAELRNSSAAVAVRDLKLMFVLAKVAEELKVRVDEGEVNQRIVQMSHERQVRPEKLRQELMQSNQIGMIVQQVREHKTLDAIVARAKVSDMAAADFNKKMAEQDKAEREGAKKK